MSTCLFMARQGDCDPPGFETTDLSTRPGCIALGLQKGGAHCGAAGTGGQGHLETAYPI